jgi:hypothetical protein
MARVLPSGRVFGEVHRLPNIQYAKEETAFDRLEKGSKSNLASIAVAGIDRIQKEIAYSEAVEAEEKRVAAAKQAMAKLEAERKALEGSRAARPAPAAAPSGFEIPAAQARAPSQGVYPSTRVEAEGPLQPRAQAPPAHIEYNDPRVASMGGGSLEAGQRLIDEAHRRLASRGAGPPDLGPSISSGKYGIGPQTRAELEQMVKEAATQQQQFTETEHQYLPSMRARTGELETEIAAAQEALTPRAVPKTGAEFVYEVMQEKDPQRRKALLYQARNAIGDSPATIQEAIGGASVMRMQGLMLKGMKEADAAVMAASEYNLKADELKVKQRTVAAKEKRETNYAKRVEAQNKRDQAYVTKLEREEEAARREAAGATGASRRKHERRAGVARIIRLHASKEMSDSEAKASLEEAGLSRTAITRATKAIDAKEKQWATLEAGKVKAEAVILAADVKEERRLETQVAAEDQAFRILERKAEIRESLAAKRTKADRGAQVVRAQLESIAKKITALERTKSSLEKVRVGHPIAWSAATKLTPEEYKNEEGSEKTLARYDEVQDYKQAKRDLEAVRADQAEKQQALNIAEKKVKEVDAAIERTERVEEPVQIWTPGR